MSLWMFLSSLILKAVLLCFSVMLPHTGAFSWSHPPGEGAGWKPSAVLASLSLGKNPEDWANNLKKEDFQLLCLDGTRKPVTEPQNCHLGRVPNHAVVSREDKADFVRRMLFNQQVWAFSPRHPSPPPTTKHSVHWQICTDTPQPSLTLILFGQWNLILAALPLIKAEGQRQCSLLAPGLSRISKWTGKASDMWAIWSVFLRLTWLSAQSWYLLGLFYHRNKGCSSVPFALGWALCGKSRMEVTLPDLGRCQYVSWTWQAEHCLGLYET